jgi:hypothetical protein
MLARSRRECHRQMKELLAQEQSIESMYLYDLVKLMAGDQTVAKTICS